MVQQPSITIHSLPSSFHSQASFYIVFAYENKILQMGEVKIKQFLFPLLRLLSFLPQSKYWESLSMHIILRKLITLHMYFCSSFLVKYNLDVTFMLVNIDIMKYYCISLSNSLCTIGLCLKIFHFSSSFEFIILSLAFKIFQYDTIFILQLYLPLSSPCPGPQPASLLVDDPLCLC